MLDGSRWQRARTWVKVISAMVGLPLSMLSVMALIGLGVEAIWFQFFAALIILVAIPLYVANQLVPMEIKGPRAEAAKGLFSDVLTATWMVTATLVLVVAIPWTRAVLHDEAERLGKAGYGTTAVVLIWVAGGNG